MRPSRKMPSCLRRYRAAVALPLACACLAWTAGCGSTSTKQDPPRPVDLRPPATDAAAQSGPVAARQFSNRSRAGTYQISWQAIGQPIPLNEPFSLQVVISPAADPEARVSGAQIFVQASMPEHNHGMLREPRAHEIAPGIYRVEGMLLHMTGHWQIFVDVVKDGIAETADFELTLE